MALPAALTGLKVTKDGVMTVLKWAVVVFLVWYAIHAVESYVEDQKALRTAIVEQSVGRAVAEQNAAVLKQAQADMEKQARLTLEALEAAKTDAASTEAQFAEFRKSQSALMKSMRSDDFLRRAGEKPKEAEAEANALMTNLNVQMEGVFDGS